MKVLIAYGTTEGQTGKIVEWIAERLRERGQDAEIFNTNSLHAELHLDAFDAVIIAASVHQERHQRSVSNFATAHRAQLDGKPTAFISVSLSVALNKDQTEAKKYVDYFIDKTGWQPGAVHLAAGAIRFSEYDYFKSQIVQFTVMKGGGPSATDKDHELTDWQAVGGFVDAFTEKAVSSCR